MNYPSLLRRFAAFSIDVVALLGIFMFLGLILGVLSGLTNLFLILPMIGFWFYGGVFATAWLYFALCESSSWQATLGKKILGLKVITTSGKKVSFGRASARHFSKFLSRLILMIGFLMIMWTKKKQGLHDKIASTIIVKS